MTRDDAGARKRAREQLQLITGEELKEEFGFSRSAIRHRRSRGRLFGILDGVFAVGHPDMTPERYAMACVLACGKDSALSHLSAAWLHEIWERAAPAKPQVSVPRSSGVVGPAAVDLRRCPTLTQANITTVRGVRVTKLYRTICDCAGLLDERGTTALIRQAQRKHGLRLIDLQDHVLTHSMRSFRHVRVARVLTRYLAGSDRTQTEREADFLQLCADNGLPLPLPQQEIAGLHPDFAWPQYRLVVELDDRESHAGAIQFGADLMRDRAYRAAGHEPLRFTVAELYTEPGTIVVELRAAMARRAVLTA